MVEAAGITEAPETWAEFREALKTLTTGDQYGISFEGGSLGDFIYRTYPFVLKAGGALLSEDWSESLVTTDPWKKAVQLLVDINNDGSNDPEYLASEMAQVADKFAENLVAMSVEGLWFPAEVTNRNPDTEVLIWTIPEPEEAYGPFTQGSLMDLACFSITSDSNNKQEAWDFITWATNEENDAPFADINNGLGGLPVCKASVNEPAWADYLGGDTYGAESPNVRGWPHYSSLVEITREILATNILKLLSGEFATVDECLETSDEAINEVLSR